MVAQQAAQQQQLAQQHQQQLAQQIQSAERQMQQLQVGDASIPPPPPLPSQPSQSASSATGTATVPIRPTTASSASTSSASAPASASSAARAPAAVNLELNPAPASASASASSSSSAAAAAAAASFDAATRGLRTAFNVSHPSPKAVADIMAEVKRVINMNRIQCQFDSLWSPHGGLSAGPTPTVLFCEKGPIRFEMEVTHVPAAAAGAPAGEQHVVRMKRVSGDSWAYKNLCNRIIPQLRL